MGATVSDVKVGGANQGRLVIDKFNLFDEEDALKYAELRTKAANQASGIKIENIREYSRKRVIRSGGGDDQTVVTEEDIYLVVQYWTKEPEPEKGANDDELQSAKLGLQGPSTA